MVCRAQHSINGMADLDLTTPFLKDVRKRRWSSRRRFHARETPSKHRKGETAKLWRHFERLTLQGGEDRPSLRRVQRWTLQHPTVFPKT
jgi:hypothetical protein